MSIYDFSQYMPQAGLLQQSQPDFTQLQGQGLLSPWTSQYQQAAGTPGLFGHQLPQLPTWQQQPSFLPDWNKMFPKTEENGNGNGNGNSDGPHAPEGGEGNPDASGSYGGTPWQDTFLGPLIQKHWGINPAAYADVEPTQEEIDAAVAAANAAPMGALERSIAEAQAGQAEVQAANQGVGYGGASYT